MPQHTSNTAAQSPPEQSPTTRHPRSQRDHIGETLVLFAIIVIAWLTVYNKSYVNGDDVVHLQSSYGAKFFLPRIGTGWIPNRVVDLYGRNLLQHILDVLYFPLHSIWGFDFFHLFKFFNATIFVIFFSVVYRYITKQSFYLITASSRGPHTPLNNFLPRLFIATALLAALPWTNEVVFVCYQISGFISFVVILEILKRLKRPDLDSAMSLPIPWLVTLSFIAAFSLEAYSAMLLCIVVFAIILTAPTRGMGPSFRRAIFCSAPLLIFCSISIALALQYSRRDAVSKRFSLFHESVGALLGYKDVVLHDRFYFAGLVGSVLLAIGLILARHYKSYQLFLSAAAVTDAREPAETEPSAETHQKLGNGESSLIFIHRALVRFAQHFNDYYIYFIIILLPSLAIVSLISMRSGYNYFDPDIYPWGNLLLIPALFAILVVATSVGKLQSSSYLYSTATTFFVMLFVSNIMIRATADPFQQYQDSRKIEKAYKEALANDPSTYDTGLFLKNIPMQIRPLPTADSPQWFKRDYRLFFWKYYHVHVHTVFR